ncbi:MAG: GH3 auxin-responsive promoter family protein, partial [Candidatus Hodarchaeota archaeon]
RLFGGVPSIIANNLEKILENSKKLGVSAKKINDIFPDYHVSFTGGVPPKYYEKKIENLVGHKVDFREQISATEGVIGIQLQQEPGFTPMVKSNFYEFIPVKNSDERCTLGEVKKNEEYFMCFSSTNGFYAYNLGDIVKFTSEDPPIFVFSRRKGVVNLVDEKLSEEDTLYAINHSNQEFKSVLTDYTVVGIRTPNFHYHVMVEFAEKSQPSSYIKYLTTLDKYLKEANDVYRYFREDIGILKSPKMWVLKKGAFSDLVTERIKQSGGSREQHKLPHLSDDIHFVKFFEDKVESEVKL